MSAVRLLSIALIVTLYFIGSTTATEFKVLKGLDIHIHKASKGGTMGAFTDKKKMRKADLDIANNMLEIYNKGEDGKFTVPKYKINLGKVSARSPKDLSDNLLLIPHDKDKDSIKEWFPKEEKWYALTDKSNSRQKLVITSTDWFYLLKDYSPWKSAKEANLLKAKKMIEDGKGINLPQLKKWFGYSGGELLGDTYGWFYSAAKLFTSAVVEPKGNTNANQQEYDYYEYEDEDETESSMNQLFTISAGVFVGVFICCMCIGALIIGGLCGYLFYHYTAQFQSQSPSNRVKNGQQYHQQIDMEAQSN